MMKQKRSIDEALSAAKAMRKQVTPSASDTEPEAHLTVVGSKAEPSPRESVSKTNPQQLPQSDELTLNPKPIWGRHTIGLHDTTSLDLRDAADLQKRKERRGQLRPGEPANEQEIADLGIRLALQQIGFSTA